MEDYHTLENLDTLTWDQVAACHCDLEAPDTAKEYVMQKRKKLLSNFCQTLPPWKPSNVLPLDNLHTFPVKMKQEGI